MAEINAQRDTEAAKRLRFLRALHGDDHPETEAAFDDRLKEATLSELLDDSCRGIYYLSFVDTEAAAAIPLDEQRPGGPSFLGGCYVEAGGPVTAMMEAHRLGCNPGGEIATYGPFDSVPEGVELGRLYCAAELGEQG